MSFVTVDGFCGAGGLSLGLKQAGFRIGYTFDSDARAVESYRRGVGRAVHRRRAEDLTGDAVMARLDASELDLLAGGPPCQGFSKQKRGAHKGDDRNRLVLEFARLVEELSPRFFLLENVAMFGQKRGREFVRRIRAMTRYHLFPHFYNSADYGLAQTRQRFVIVGQRTDLTAPFYVPPPTHRVWRTVGEVMRGLPEPPLDYSVHPSFPKSSARTRHRTQCAPLLACTAGRRLATYSRGASPDLPQKGQHESRRLARRLWSFGPRRPGSHDYRGVRQLQPRPLRPPVRRSTSHASRSCPIAGLPGRLRVRGYTLRRSHSDRQRRATSLGPRHRACHWAVAGRGGRPSQRNARAGRDGGGPAAVDRLTRGA